LTSKEGWRSIRRVRSDPPALAREDDHRKLVFQASLAQAEELWDAAAVAGPASRPLPLFYCVSQAGRAVCAAWLNQDVWQPGAHGLTRDRSDDGDAGRADSEHIEPGIRVLSYAARVTRRPEAPAYPMIAEATGSTTFAGVATVVELWASLPGFPRVPNDPSPRCLRLEGVPPPMREVRSVLELLATPTHAVLHDYGRPREVREASEPSETYPTLLGIEEDGARPNPLTGLRQPIFRFPRADGTLRSLLEVGVRDPGAGQRSLDYLVRPAIGSDTRREPPSEFLTLWALLFCLSELARYYPDTWVAALDPDSSAQAVTLEHGLDVALARVPDLIVDALGGPRALMRDAAIRLAAEGAGAESAEVEIETGEPEEPVSG
jgi:hypothetical protein